MYWDRPQDKFKGDPSVLREFLRLARSPIRSEEREMELERWRRYKTSKALELYQAQHSDTLHKGWHNCAWRDHLIDLSGINLDGAVIGYADLRGVRMDGASMRGTWMKGAEFEQASLVGVDFSPLFPGETGDLSCQQSTRLLQSDFTGADLRDANLAGADLSDTTFRNANLTGTDLSGADLTRSVLVEADVSGATLCGNRIYGVAAWNVRGTAEATFRDLIITGEGDPAITVDHLEVAQFIYLLLDNENLRNVLDTVTSTVVLILGRFTAERKPVLDAMRVKLKSSGYTPVLFDFERPGSKSFIGTIKTLAGLSRFVVADMTDAKVVLQELQVILDQFPGLPVKPLLLEEASPPGVLLDFMEYQNCLSLARYSSQEHLVTEFEHIVLQEAESKVAEIQAKRRNAQQILNEL